MANGAAMDGLPHDCVSYILGHCGLRASCRAMSACTLFKSVPMRAVVARMSARQKARHIITYGSQLAQSTLELLIDDDACNIRVQVTSGIGRLSARPLYMACLRGDERTALAILANGNTSFACQWRRWTTDGARCTSHFETALHAAARAGSVRTVSALVAGDDRLVRAPDSNGSLAVLHAAAMAAVCTPELIEGYVTVIRLLLAIGTGAESRNVFGVSANDYMHAACARADVSSAVHDLQDVTSAPVRVRRTLPRLFGPLGRPGNRWITSRVH